MKNLVEARPRLDGQLEAIAHVHRRRILLELLDENPQPAGPAVLNGQANASNHEKLQATMYHVHLPKLEARGFVQWDQDENRLTKGPKFEDVAPLLEVLDEHRHELPDGGER